MGLEHLVRTAIGSLIALAVFSVLSGCATQGVPGPVVQSYLEDKPPALEPYYRKAILAGSREWVLNQMEAGLAAMEIGELPAAAYSFDEALRGIETVYANNANADAALHAWREEGSKDFKGEPYERVMAYYYRGLLYLQEGDFENARASFKAGALQDSIAENAEYQEDFALMHFMEGWASQCNGDAEMARDAFAAATQLRSGLHAPAPSERVLVVAETGRGPRKIADGPDGSWLRFRPGTATADDEVRVTADGRSVDAFPIEDVYFQASTRGARPVEVILEGKAHFKEDMSTLGQGAMAAGLAVMSASGGNSDVAAVGVGIAAAGFLIDMGSRLVKPGADTRVWHSLPAKVHVAAVSSTEGPLSVAFLDATGMPLDGGTQVGTVSPGVGSCLLVWVRSGSEEGSLVARRPLGLELASAR